MTSEDNSRENHLRQMARRQGCFIIKSNAVPSPTGCYWLIDPQWLDPDSGDPSVPIESGTLDDIEEWLTENGGEEDE